MTSTLHDELNRIGYQMLSRRAHAAETFARNALAMTPYTGETAQEFANRLRFCAERNHPELILRFEHSRIEVYKLADFCGCALDADDYDEHHGESDEDGRALCSKGFLGWICGDCDNEDGEGPEWSPDRFEWPCPPVARLDGLKADPAAA
jgi:hypothetical protein